MKNALLLGASALLSVPLLLLLPVPAQAQAAVAVGKVLVQVGKAFVIGIGTGAGEEAGKALVQKYLNLYPPPDDQAKEKTYTLPDGLRFQYTLKGQEAGKPIYGLGLLPKAESLLNQTQTQSSSAALLSEWTKLSTSSNLTPTTSFTDILKDSHRFKPLFPSLATAAGTPAQPSGDEVMQWVRAGKLWHVARVRNGTNTPVLYYVANPDGSWFRNLLEPGGTFWHVRQNTPIKINYDADLAEGYQAQELEIQSGVVFGHEPTQAEKDQADLSIFTMSSGNGIELLSVKP
ncbi:MAG: hypothetical protein U1F68_14655 [Gammaproteobacteria bacterium]